MTTTNLKVSLKRTITIEIVDILTPGPQVILPDEEKEAYFTFDDYLAGSYPQLPEPALVGRHDIPRYMFRDYLDFNYRHLSHQIPSWVMGAGTYIKKHLPGLALANTYPHQGHLGGFQ